MQSENSEKIIEQIKASIPKDFPGMVVIIVSESDDDGTTVVFSGGEVGYKQLKRVGDAFNGLMSKAAHDVLKAHLADIPSELEEVLT